MRVQLVEIILLAMLGAGTALAGDLPVTVQDLEQRGAVEIARGRLLEESRVVCWPLLGDPGCGEPRQTYGEFRRLKLGDVEFVCMSFRGWACTEAH